MGAEPPKWAVMDTTRPPPGCSPPGERTPAYELEHGQNTGLRALNLDVTDALAIARQVEDDEAQLLHTFSS